MQLINAIDWNSFLKVPSGQNSYWVSKRSHVNPTYQLSSCPFTFCPCHLVSTHSFIHIASLSPSLNLLLVHSCCIIVSLFVCLSSLPPLAAYCQPISTPFALNPSLCYKFFVLLQILCFAFVVLVFVWSFLL